MVDPITLEVLRCKLEAAADEGARTIKRTAISPTVSESGDCSCSIYGPAGDLIAGGGAVRIHYHAGSNGVAAILKKHGSTIASGDMFLVNDTYNGGGLHANDVFIHIPIFHDDQLTAWVGASAHMSDMGGAMPGSRSMTATEVYQEAFRVPPVRIYRQGVEQDDIWQIVRTNIRMANVVEMDMRSLIAGANVIRSKVIDMLGRFGVGVFREATAELTRRTEREIRRRISELEPGVYKAASWSEWHEEFFHIPCRMTVEHDRIVFDFYGAPPQTQHYFNSKTFVMESVIGVALGHLLGQGLPFNEGVFRAFEVRCEPGSILDAQSPAPIGGPHLDVGQNALESAMRVLSLAVASSPRSPARRILSGPSSSSALANHVLSGVGFAGDPIAWVMLDGALNGGSAGHDRDATPMCYRVIGAGVLAITDVEVMESWYPIRFEYRRLREGAGGAGAFCAGRSASLSYTVAGVFELSLTTMGNRERLTISGMAGGLPGAVTRFQLRRSGARDPEPLYAHTEDVRLFEGDAVILDNGNGGGWGDPLRRDPVLVADDLRRGLLRAEEARTIFGVEPDDPEATVSLRSKIRRERLARAEPPPHPLKWTPDLRRLAEGLRAPLGPEVLQSGALAVGERSGAPLAVSPRPWTEGCPRIHSFVASSSDVDVTAYLDPQSGDLLAVDVVTAGSPCSFEVSPERWVRASDSRAGQSALLAQNT